MPEPVPADPARLRLSPRFPPGGFYAVLDAARDATIHPKLRQLARAGVPVASLYEGAARTELAAVAPYLVSLDGGEDALRWLMSHGAGGRWGILLWSASAFADVRGHLRTLTRVRTEDGRVLLFRFYDPRCLRPFLPLCSTAQLADLYGPVAAFGVETAAGDDYDLFAWDGAALSRSALAGPPPA